MAKVKTEVSRERKARVLSALCACGAQRKAVELPFKEIAAETGLTFDQVRSSIRALEGEGRVRVLPRHLPNGGTMANAYRVVAPRPERRDEEKAR